ncbi:LOW QUALITY PROTEIN: hypothetical protein U9M48_024788 [Paspalum notatum var. saurae]|uniref:NB-ARC domain-containing protein n=1 Tax=Paspalum notatum var. saurae TaxID=547442 RepID=A0AAQ3TTP0_PASNO
MSLSKTIEVINVINEFGNLFQLVISGVSYMRSRWNGSQDKELKQDDVLQLQSDLQCLLNTLPEMYNLIDRAEWKIHEPFVAQQLPKLKDAVSDADGLLDEFIWYKQKWTARRMQRNHVIRGSFNKVIDIQNKRLKNISSPLEKVGLHQTTPRFDKLVRPETTSFPIEAKIFGRDKEIKELIKLLGVPANNSKGPSRCKKPKIGADNNETTITSVPVLPIVGMGGVGKTTLAQNVCNRPKVKSHFDLIIWICVSDDFDVKRLTKEALQSLSSNKVTTTDNLDSLQRALSDLVNGKRLLLILDDMWDDALKEIGQRWKRFIAPFTNVLCESMILVTTRLQKVADLVRTTDSFPLDGLKDDVFLNFFEQCVFGSERSNYDPELNRIGMEILPKLRGSPLAAKTLGRLLGMSFDPAHWDRILKSQLWELSQEETDILPAFRLSYMYLPFHLKRCFSFCAVYPKDHEFEREDLAEIWVAEGLVEPQPNVPLQHTCCRYFDELEHLSFFQKLRGKYVMHDLIHDMAQLVSKDEYFIIKDREDFQKIPENVRHVSELKSSGVKCSDLLNLCKHKKLRTLLCNMSLKSKDGNTVMEKWSTELLCLRVIVCASISRWGLPGSISNMKHLRYLKILDTCLCRTLPAAFCCLYDLQIFYAKKWEIGNIPSGFGTLTNLQKFESSTYQFHHEHSVYTRGGATGEGQKRQFQFNRYNGESPPDGFNPENLPNITSLLFRGLDHFQRVSFFVNSNRIHSDDSIGSTLSPQIEVGIVCCQNLSSLKQFLQPAYVPVIRKISISNCLSLESVPADRFGDFSFLEVLKVRNCPNISSGRLFAPSLKELYLERSGNLGDNIECRSLTILELLFYPLASIELQMWNLPLLQKLKI